MQRTIDSLFRLAAGLSLLLLAACGGGGGAGIGGSLPPIQTAPPASASNGNTANAPTEPAAVPGSEELAAFTLLNGERMKCGFGALARNGQLDTAARGHANWLLINNYGGHYQQEGTLEFTGVNQLDRSRAVGYEPAWIHDESVAYSRSSSAKNRGVEAVRDLLSAPYHLRGMVSGTRDVGISVMSSDEAGTTKKIRPRVISHFNLAYTAAEGPQEQDPGAVLSYPCDGTDETASKLTNESPNPLPGRNLALAPIGQPVYLRGNTDTTLAINSALMQEVATGNTVALLPVMTAQSDANAILKINEAIVMPDTPLKANAQYRVTIVGVHGSTSFTKEFIFKTGTAPEGNP